MVHLVNMQLGVTQPGHESKWFSALRLCTSAERCSLPISVANLAQRNGQEQDAFFAQGVSQRIVR
ncbi:MAG: hypothetical protein NZT92_05480 [Abditibacteriales bacterium]|nr:hypothetical protein [Abditibacteriales bacterium]MDW8365417.1 hypothetical protein [Abditibacteriales bacterium]